MSLFLRSTMYPIELLDNCCQHQNCLPSQSNVAQGINDESKFVKPLQQIAALIFCLFDMIWDDDDTFLEVLRPICSSSTSSPMTRLQQSFSIPESCGSSDLWHGKLDSHHWKNYEWILFGYIRTSTLTWSLYFREAFHIWMTKSVQVTKTSEKYRKKTSKRFEKAQKESLFCVFTVFRLMAPKMIHFLSKRFPMWRWYDLLFVMPRFRILRPWAWNELGLRKFALTGHMRYDKWCKSLERGLIERDECIQRWKYDIKHLHTH